MSYAIILPQVAQNAENHSVSDYGLLLHAVLWSQLTTVCLNIAHGRRK